MEASHLILYVFVFFLQAEDGIRYLVRSRGLGDVYKRQIVNGAINSIKALLGISSPSQLFHDIGANIGAGLVTVSYTHLTLPTSDLV